MTCQEAIAQMIPQACYVDAVNPPFFVGTLEHLAADWRRFRRTFSQDCISAEATAPACSTELSCRHDSSRLPYLDGRGARSHLTDDEQAIVRREFVDDYALHAAALKISALSHQLEGADLLTTDAAAVVAADLEAAEGAFLEASRRAAVRNRACTERWPAGTDGQGADVDALKTGVIVTPEGHLRIMGT